MFHIAPGDLIYAMRCALTRRVEPEVGRKSKAACASMSAIAEFRNMIISRISGINQPA